MDAGRAPGEPSGAPRAFCGCCFGAGQQRLIFAAFRDQLRMVTCPQCRGSGRADEGQGMQVQVRVPATLIARQLPDLRSELSDPGAVIAQDVRQ